MSYLIGVDIGGTSVKLGLIQYGERFQVLKQSSIATQPNDAADIFVQRIAAAVADLAASAGRIAIDGIGIGCPGLIDPWAGIVRTAPNLKNIAGFKLRDELSRLTGIRAALQNDANAAVLGEWLFSESSKNLNNLVLFTLGTGVGGGVICDSHLLVGAANAATELGHVKIDYGPSAALCACGKRGCIEAYAGIAGIRRIANSLIAKGAKTSLAAGDSLTTKDLAIAAKAGDEIAQQTFFTVGQYLARGIAICLETFNPEKVVIGGGASAAFDLLLPGINAGLDECSSFEFIRKSCKIERSAFPDDINVIGAAATWLNSQKAG